MPESIRVLPLYVVMNADFECRRCGNCCRWPGYVRLESDEIAPIAGLLGVDEAEFIAEQTRLTGDRRGLSLLENADGSCPFLSAAAEGAICRIQAAKPRQCRNFPLGWNFPGWEAECAGAGKGNAVEEDGGSAASTANGKKG